LENNQISGDGMSKFKFEIITGCIFTVILIAFCLWQNPAGAKLSKAEIDTCLKTAESRLVFENKEQVLIRLRAWAEADDGKPVYMLNLMRNYPEIKHYAGAPDFKGTPEEANRYYESKAIPMLFKNGGYPVFAGIPQAKCVVGSYQFIDDLTRILVVRYTSRRAFLQLLTDPAYAPIESYKMMALELSLLPMSSEMVIPDVRFVLGSVLLVLFLAVGWVRSARRKKD
jgi:hypothetical protein